MSGAAAVKAALVWLVRAYVTAAAVTPVVVPPLVAGEVFGWRVGVVAGIATVGAGAFVWRFGPWLLGRALAGDMQATAEAVAGAIERDIRWLDRRHDRMENHAAAEGIELHAWNTRQGSFATPAGEKDA